MKDLAREEYEGPVVGDWKTILRQITSGLDYLHRKEVIHCHLKPTNVLISIPDSGVPPMMKLANFGVVKRVSSKIGNPVSLWKLGGSKGWLPAEAYIQTLFTPEMDVFALGLLFGYSLNKGCHPFGEDKEERVVKMKKSEPLILTSNHLQNVADPEKVFQLITSMQSSEPSARPTTSQVLNDASLSFIARTSDLGVPLESGKFILIFFCVLHHFNQAFLYLTETPNFRNIKNEAVDNEEEVSIIAVHRPQKKGAKGAQSFHL